MIMAKVHHLFVCFQVQDLDISLMMEEGDQGSLGDDILDFLKVLFYGPPKSKKAAEKKEKLSKAQRKKEKGNKLRLLETATVTGYFDTL